MLYIGAILDVGLPVFTVGIASVTIGVDIDLQGHYSLRESGDPDNPGMFTAAPCDPDSSLLDNIPSPLGGATSTHLAGSAGLEITAGVCVDFGWFGTYCGDFVVFDDEVIDMRDPVNVITYSPDGVPLHSEWASGNVSNDPETIQYQINECLSAPAIDQDAEEAASPVEWKDFFDDVKETFSEHYFVCQKNDPPPPQVAYEPPSFKLCDTLGNVYEAVDGLRPGQ